MTTLGRLLVAAGAGVLLLAACGPQFSAASGAGTSDSLVQEGDKAPPFVLPSAAGDKVTLSQFRGRMPVLLYFSMGPG